MNRLFCNCVVALAMVIPVNLMCAADKGAQDDWIHVNVKGLTKWFNLAELRKISKEHVIKRNPRFEESKFEVTASIFSDDPVKLVGFQYFQNFGLPVIRITFDKNGEVLSYEEKIASEATPDSSVPGRKAK